MDDDEVAEVKYWAKRIMLAVIELGHEEEPDPRVFVSAMLLATVDLRRIAGYAVPDYKLMQTMQELHWSGE